MKVIDLHTKKETDSSFQGKHIDNTAVKSYVLKKIDFPLTDEQWASIDSAFAEIWNNKLGRGAEFYWDEIPPQVFEALKQQKVLISFDRVVIVVDLILTFIEKTGGFLE